MTIIKFEGVDTTANGVGSPIPDLYGGMHWQAIYAMNTHGPADDGYKMGVHSGRADAYNDPGIGIAQKFSADTSFSLKSMYLTVLNTPADITIRAFVGDTEVGHRTFHVTGEDIFFFPPKFHHITAVQIESPGNHAVFDDVKVIFDDAAPTAATPPAPGIEHTFHGNGAHAPTGAHHDIISFV